jgi:hypothetical protein
MDASSVCVDDDANRVQLADADPATVDPRVAVDLPPLSAAKGL